MMGIIESLRQNTDLPVIFADSNGVVTYINTKFQEAFGWTNESLVGQELTKVIPKSMHDAHHLGFSRFLTSGQPTVLNKTLNLYIIAADGTNIHSEHVICAEKIKGEWFFGATIRPIEV